MKIRVVPIAPAGRSTRGMLAKRFLVQGVAGAFVPFFSYLDGLWQLWDKPLPAVPPRQVRANRGR